MNLVTSTSFPCVQGGNKSAQDSIFIMLSGGGDTAQAVFDNMSAAFLRAKKYITRKDFMVRKKTAGSRSLVKRQGTGEHSRC